MRAAATCKAQYRGDTKRIGPKRTQGRRREDAAHAHTVRPKQAGRPRAPKLGANRGLRKRAPVPSPRKTTGQDWRAQTLAERANQPPPRAEEPAGESEAALRAFLDTAEAEPGLPVC